MDEVYQPDFAYWAKLPEWTVEEASALLLEFEPRLVRFLDWREEEEYLALCELAQRCFNAGQIGYPATPAEWIAWARRVGQPMPRGLEAVGEVFEGCDADRDPTPQQREILRAVSELWPDGNLPSRTGDRDPKIKSWFKSRQLTAPGASSIRATLGFFRR